MGIDTFDKFVRNYLERNADALALLGDKIFYFGELGMQEHETARLMTRVLEEAGFRVERGISGFPTGFCASYGSGGPVVALISEYDSIPDNSQRAGVLQQEPIVEGAPGHCEGHNLNASVLVGAALAAKAAMDAFGLAGTLKVFGGPAEEQLVSRPYFVRDGWFDGVDVVFHDHVSSDFSTGYGVSQNALISATFHFHGETAHAGVAPWKGRDALDAVVLMDMGVAQYREHMLPTMMAQRVITKGGDQPNVIPRHAAAWWYFRDVSAAGAEQLFRRVSKIAEGAALMSDTQLEIEVMSAVWPFRGNRTLADLLQASMTRVGMPAWTPEEETFAKDLQRALGLPEVGLTREVKPMTGPAVQRSSANDIGDISWKAPMAKLYFPANVPGATAHHWGAGVVLAHRIGHKGAEAGATALAFATLECFRNPAIVEEAKRTFAEEVAGVQYRSLLPPGQKPPVTLNHDLMERFRPQMAKHYLADEPRFA
jgi:aminobenzoyl-glutamate utilization protein B